MRRTWAFAEFGAHAADRWPVEGLETLELTDEEVGEMNRRLLLTPCRVLPLRCFPWLEKP